MTDDRPGAVPPAPDDELVPEDDAVIGRALRRSLVVLGAIAVVVVLVVVARWRPVEPERVVEKVAVGTIRDRPVASPRMPTVPFVDATAASGIDFVHENGAAGMKLLPETMGGGVAVIDHDVDGDPDLFFVNSDRWPDSVNGGPRPTSHLYANDGTGRFRDVSAEAGLDFTAYGMGAAVGDYDNDGDPDLFVTALGPNRLLRNDGGRFTDVTKQAGVAGEAQRWSASAGFFDYDNDGDLDLFVCNYVEWSREIDVELDFTLNGRDRAYGPPTNYGGTYPYLYRNEGDGSFTDVSDEAGVRIDNPATGAPMAKSLGLAFVDADLDGFLDVLVANDTVQNFLLRNKGDGSFEELGADSGFGFDGAGNPTGAMGVDTAHYRNDEQLAVGVANFANEMSSLYVAQRAGLLQFTNEAAGEGIGAPSRLVLSFGLFFFDYDLDSRADLFQANGHLEDEIHEVQQSQTYRQPAQLFWNAGDDARSCFVEVPRDLSGDLAEPFVGRGAAYADIDGDGDLDVVLTQTGDRAVVFRNDQALGNRWLRVLPSGGGAVNRDAIGTWIELEAGGVLQRRQVMPTRSYLSSVERTVTFGLGDAERIDALRISWPDGTTERLDPPAPGSTLQIER